MTVVIEAHDYLPAVSEAPAGIPGVQLSVRAVRGRLASGPYGGFHDQIRLIGARWGLAVGDALALRQPFSEASLAAGQQMAGAVLRAMALTDLAPSMVLAGMNRALLAWSRTERTCLTIAYADVEPTWRGLRVRLCLAGGPTAFVREARGRAHAVGQPGDSLGVRADARLRNAQFLLHAGDSLVLVAEGVLEALGGPDRICEILAQADGSSAARNTDAVVAAVREAGGGQVAREAVVLALKVPLRRRNAGTRSAGWPGGTRYPSA